ncbi:flagellar hook-length control protein FliK [Oceanisphaera psychrotolerans]|nr:flagellar hook-length control protein FliK [Oceanisphaera psychrotolerans]
MMIGTVTATTGAGAKAGGLAAAEKGDAGFAELLSGQQAAAVADDNSASRPSNQAPGHAAREEQQEQTRADDREDEAGAPFLASQSAPVAPEARAALGAGDAAVNDETGAAPAATAADGEADALQDERVAREYQLKAARAEKAMEVEAGEVDADADGAEQPVRTARRQEPERDATALSSDEPTGDWLEQIAHSRRLLQATAAESGNDLPPEANVALAAAAGEDAGVALSSTGDDGINVTPAFSRDAQTPLSNERLLSPERSLSLLGSPEQSAKQLAQQVQVMVNQNLQAADIRLSPSELGGLRIQVKMEQGEVQVQFLASQPQARELFDQALPRLREMLGQQGLNLSQGQQGALHQGDRQQAGTQEQGPRGGEAALEETERLEVREAEWPGRRAPEHGGIDFFA